jgi:BASS family bile acid:Na+ symporter
MLLKIDMIENLDNIRINFDTDNLWVVNITLALIMFGVALDIKTTDFTNLLKSPRPVIVGIISQFLLIPFITFLLVNIIDPEPSIALGMIIVGACPGGNISNFMSKLAGGNAALSISLTAFASIASLFMTPLNIAIWANMYEPTSIILERVALDPLEVSKIVLLILGIPLVLGMLIKHYYSKFASKFSKILKPISILIFLSFIVGAFYNNLEIFTTHIHHVIFLVILHNAVLFVAGFYFARINKLAYNDQKTLSIETGIQNAGLGLMLVFTFFNGLGGTALLVAFWAIWDILSGLVVAFIWSSKVPKIATL